MTNEVAQTILSQLGGGRFVMMTGAKHLMSTSTQRGGLRFQLPATPHFVKNRIRVMEIVLTEADLYDLRCFVKHAGAPLGSCRGPRRTNSRAVRRRRRRHALSFGPWNSTKNSAMLSFAISTFQSLISLRKPKGTTFRSAFRVPAPRAAAHAQLHHVHLAPLARARHGARAAGGAGRARAARGSSSVGRGACTGAPRQQSARRATAHLATRNAAQTGEHEK